MTPGENSGSRTGRGAALRDRPSCLLPTGQTPTEGVLGEGPRPRGTGHRGQTAHSTHTWGCRRGTQRTRAGGEAQESEQGARAGRTSARQAEVPGLCGCLLGSTSLLCPYLAAIRGRPERLGSESPTLGNPAHDNEEAAGPPLMRGLRPGCGWMELRTPSHCPEHKPGLSSLPPGLLPHRLHPRAG